MPSYPNLSSYGRSPEEEQNPIDMLPLGAQAPDLNTGPMGLAPLSPGQPVGAQQGKGPSNKWALLGAPILALLGSKLSGGQMPFNEALGALGQGFAQEKFGQLKQRRQQAFDQEGQTIEMAHEAVKGLKDIHPETLKQFPQLQQLAFKYQEAMANDGRISPKEAADIVVEAQRMQHVMGKARQQQQQTTADDTFKRQFEMKQGLEREGRIGDLTMLMGDEPGVEEGDKRDLAMEMLRDRDTMRLERETPVPFDIGGRTFNVLPNEAVSMAKQQETERHNLELERIRANAQSLMVSKQLQMEMFRDARANWEQNRSAAIAEAGDDPEMRAQVIREFLTTMPKLADYAGGGRGPVERMPSFGDVQGMGDSGKARKYSNVRAVN